ncbi:SpoIIE family protein phosphatase [Streptomyces sp. TRM72054]|uniref:SpoIIE family protein phosphatase n=1 Tax=Streptomyces sp. TRM72054 TaxID=2870562 RepID=UPI001C8B41E4|nr:SpoIIE family protein phosphatase [Streptomyces sp. TRM72054]MBX9396698.1 SpoIIE family protein phosphatase [Streptomyces sp. TRM72054]
MSATHSTGSGRPVHGPVARERIHVLVDRQGRLVRWSPAAERLLGYPEDAVQGRSALGLLAGPAADGRSPVSGEDFAVALRHRDGGLVRCRLAVRPQRAGDAGTGWEVLLAPAEEDGTAEAERALLETLFTLSPMGLFLLDPQLRLLRFNPAAEGMQGTSVAEAVGRRPTEVWPGLAVQTVERAMKEVLATGRPAIGVEKRVRPPGDPHHDHVYSASLFRLQDAQGRILGVADATVDVTERHLAHERLTALAQASTRIGATLDALDTARGLAEVSVPVPADSVAVEVLAGVLAGEELEAGPVRPGTVLRRAACHSRDDEPSGTAAGHDGPLSAAASGEALADLEPRLVDPLCSLGQEILRCMRTPAGAGEDADAGRDADAGKGKNADAGKDADARQEVHSLIVAPLVAQDRALGLATFCRWGERRPFGPDDLTLVAQLARRTAESLDNARRHLREHNSLAALQHILRPGGLPPQQALEVAHSHVSAGSGGDWVDALPLSGARLALVAGRVRGRGIQSAAAAGRLRAAVHTLSDLDLEPDELLARLDDIVRGPGRANGFAGSGDRPSPAPDTARSTHGQLCGATCLYLIYDPVSRRCSVSTAGHPWPVVVHPDGAVRRVLAPVADALCCPGGPFGREDFDVPENSTLVLYTPGLLQPERPAPGEERQQEPDDAGRDRLTALLTHAPDSVQATCRTLTDALVPPVPRDDAAVLVARTHALDRAHVASWDLPSDPAMVSTARSLATRQLAAWDMSEAAFVTELIVSELVTNAIRYGKPPVTLRLIRSHVLTCEVSDGSSTAPRLRHARTTDEGGRGLLLVARSSDRWGTRYTEDGKIVWVEQSTD